MISWFMYILSLLLSHKEGFVLAMFCCDVFEYALTNLHNVTGESGVNFPILTDVGVCIIGFHEIEPIFVIFFVRMNYKIEKV